ncbi:hypothetical protein BD414DRAFT_181923 [Trametes punicea]|nr:hypothetical protein BD414DRAFT_181923 [Trametes punicea]
MSNHSSVSPPAAAAPDPACPARASSRIGHRRPPLVRTVSSRNLFPDLPRIATLKVTSPSSSDSDSSDEEDKPNPLSIALPPLCPPSPISPTSSSSDSSLDSAASSTEDLTDYEDQPGFDGFPPPPLPHASYVPPPPQQPLTPIDSLDNDPPVLFHHGLSRSAFAAYREFWDRRYHLWQTWRDHVDHLDSIQADYARDGLRATLRYPPPPALPRTRDVPGQGANGIIPGETPPRPLWYPPARLQTYNPYSPIFPRVGDIAALRDPYCDWNDRAFIHFPTYSIHKILYLNDMLLREQDLRRHRSAQPSPLSEAHVPVSPASAYSADSSDEPSGCDASPSKDALPSAPQQDASRPWEVDWRARWQVLIDRQPHPPPPPYMHDHAPPSPSDPVHSWSAPSPMSPVFAPPPPSPDASDEDEDRPFVWQESNDVPELVPVQSPLTSAEVEYGSTSITTRDIADLRESSPVQGWSAPEPELAPVVKLPASTSKSAGLRRVGSSESLQRLPLGSYESLQRPPLYSAASVMSPASSDNDSDGEEGGEEQTGSSERPAALPPRPASASPMFFFYDEDVDVDMDSNPFAVGAAGIEGMVSVSVQAVPC